MFLRNFALCVVCTFCAWKPPEAVSKHIYVLAFGGFGDGDKVEILAH